VALVRSGGGGADLLPRLAELARRLPPSQRPIRWIACPDLAPDGRGKWERGRWRSWLERPVSDPGRPGDAGTARG
jgi:O-succinylbenzoic acid--CoA ligase